MRKVIRKNKTIDVALILVIASSVVFYAFSSGITGRTLKNGDGCTCHNSTPSTNVTVQISGPDELAPDETGNYTVTISGGPLAAAGTNIAASEGTLAPVGNDLRFSSSELTHTSPKSPSGGAVTFEFTYTAPSTEGEQTLYANGNSVNGNGSNSGDQWNFAANKIINVTVPTSVEDENTVATFRLNQNYPNPFNPSTVISYELSGFSNVTLKVYDVLGKEVNILVNNAQQAGTYQVEFNAGDLPSGVYLYRLNAGSYVETRKMILTK